MNDQVENKKCISEVDNAMKDNVSPIWGAKEVKS
jgi:hypothetical protein